MTRAFLVLAPLGQRLIRFAAVALALGAVAACTPEQPDQSAGGLASVTDLDRGGALYSQIAPNARPTAVSVVAPASHAEPRAPLLSGQGIDLPP